MFDPARRNIYAFFDTVARIVIAPSELPVGIITSFIGAPVFCMAYFKKKRVIQ
ncbi:MAG: iron chelate uptake ABC transporter family permease subunit [Ignavibacteria bacterium]|nr:iron chelate uptake ABC transporter family permease subunit [Ignavibacteria bacterium]